MSRLQLLLQGHLSRESERGATATEYALLVGFIALVLVMAVTFFGTELNGVFMDYGSRLQDVL